ncbi:MAG: glycosyltransferase family 2 protein [Janthinobacterium lividum]
MSKTASPLVEIALATWNGARFLPEQLASLAAQRWPELAIVASDDGSTDGTRAILQAFTARPLRLLPGEGRLGVRGNFAAALAATQAPYVFLSDQDDWWDPDKVPAIMARLLELERALGADYPLLVYCDLAIVDETLQPTGGTWFTATSKASGSLDLADLVLTGHVPGCAMAMNRALLDLALPIPDRAYIHDWWLAQVAAVKGTIAYVDRPLIRYRQHGGNTLGSATAMSSPVAKLAAVLRRPLSGVRRQLATYDAQAAIADGNLAALRARFGRDLPAPALTLLDGFARAGWWHRYRLLRTARTGASLPARAALTLRMGRHPPG